MENINNFISNYEATSKNKLSSEIKKKGKFDYLSWAYALKNLKSFYPDASFKTVKYPDDKGELVLPFLKTDIGYFVSTEIFLTVNDKVNNIGYEYTFPVLNSSNKTIEKPSAFEINTSLQRCLAKNIAVVTGCGLSLFTNEDIPDDDPDKFQEKMDKQEVKTPVKSNEQLEMQKDFIFVFKNGTLHQWTNLMAKWLKKKPELANNKEFEAWVNKYKPNPKSDVELMQEATAEGSK